MLKYAIISPLALDNHATLQYIYIMRQKTKGKAMTSEEKKVKAEAEEDAKDLAAYRHWKGFIIIKERIMRNRRLRELARK